MDRLAFPKGLLLLLLLAVLCGPAFGADDKSPEEFGGVGLQVVPTIHGDLVVLQVMSGSPAATAGLQPGDLIYQVEDFLLRGSEFAVVVSKHLWGPVGSRVTVHYLRPGTVGPHSAVLERTVMTPRLTVSPSVSGGSH